MAQDQNPDEEAAASLRALDKETLIRIVLDDAKNWLAHDGLWFQAIEKTHGMDVAIEADRAAWEKFDRGRGPRIMERLGLRPSGGIPALLECLQHRFYARLNIQEATEVTETRAVLRCATVGCSRPASARGSPTSPARAWASSSTPSLPRHVDPRIQTRCLACRPMPTRTTAGAAGSSPSRQGPARAEPRRASGSREARGCERLAQELATDALPGDRILYGHPSWRCT